MTVRPASLLSDHDVYLFREGSHSGLYDRMGAHPTRIDDEEGTLFAVWAPNAREVSVVGEFNRWTPGEDLLLPRWDHSGIWEGFLPGIEKGAFYKYHIVSNLGGPGFLKGDPFAFRWETPPGTASRVWDLDYAWEDEAWMARRAEANSLDAPWSVYEVHLGSWKRVPGEENRSLTYRELAAELVPYVREMGFTHVEILPIMEHPFYGSWGYQTTGYFAPTDRYGSPQDFMFLVDRFHQNGIGVLLDWVPSHFPVDAHGLARFDGTSLYEHSDPKEGFHPDWKSFIFNYGRHEVRAFLMSSALFWLDRYHADGLRVDAVASMLYLDYSRKAGEWIPNEFGGRENTRAIVFLQKFNEAVYRDHPGTQTAAEESTAWPMVSRPTYLGGLGFGMKWNMGWMHDTLDYFSRDPIHRKYHHNQLTFSIWYAFSENFVLPLSHDEVTYGKGSLLTRMPGDIWQKAANVRLLFGYLYGHPGKKLLFMGGEFGQWNEWYHEAGLDWHLLETPLHQGIRTWVRDLNRLHTAEPALHRADFGREGFEWIDFRDWESSVMGFLRKDPGTRDSVLVVCNFTPIPRAGYRMGVPRSGVWRELLNSDGADYGGSGKGNLGGVEAEPVSAHGHPWSLSLTIPPLGVLFLKSPAP
jgi:1,4-alpha-glucan branching enzyme